MRQFSEDEGEAVREFVKFVAEGIGKDEDDEFSPWQSDGRVIGGEEFVGRIQEGERGVTARQVTLDEIIGSVCAVCGVEREDLIASGRGRQGAAARSIVGLVVQEEGGITLTEAARVLRRDTSSLTAGAARLRVKLDGDEALRDRLAKVKADLQIP